MNSPLTENKNKNPLPPVQHEEIVVRAREFWQKAGSPAGRDLEFWLAAEHDLRLERENVKDTMAAVARSESRPGAAVEFGGGRRRQRNPDAATKGEGPRSRDVAH